PSSNLITPRSYSTYHSLLCCSFHCYGPHRDLHSFPTRRSSDLGQVIIPWKDAENPVLLIQKVIVPGMAQIAVPVHHKDLNGEIPDRKSTRLNSSHVSISYAVFCLKKKKKTKRK